MEGEKSIGYVKQMFYQGKRAMQGATKFSDAGLDIISASKGQHALKQFIPLMNNKEYEKCNTYTLTKA